MKQIIIVLLIIILGVIGYGQYSKYKRFSLVEYEYKIPETVKGNLENLDLFYKYHQAVEEVNGYVITQWSANKIDVRNPKDDDATTKAAVSKYRNKLAKVAFYEAQLLQPSEKNLPKITSEEDRKKELIKDQFYSDPSKYEMRLGNRNAMVFELQRMLIANGHQIRHDGIFNSETLSALKDFEASKGLYSDGKLDAITLEYLLK